MCGVTDTVGRAADARLVFDNWTLPKASTVVREARSRRGEKHGKRRHDKILHFACLARVDLNRSSARTALAVITRVSAGSWIVGFEVLAVAIIRARGTLPRRVVNALLW
jgi:hypothetical protein